jgi:nitrate reductase NapD
MNISSAIVYSRPDQEGALRTQLAALTGIEVHAVTDDGKMVITIEADNDRAAVDTYETIERLPGVLSMAMIFQQSESNPEQELQLCK